MENRKLKFSPTLAAVLLSAFMLASCSALRFSQVPESQNGWPMFGRDASHNSVVKKSSVLLQRAWEFNAGAGFGDFSPIIEGGRVFIGTLNGNVVTLNVENGKEEGGKMFGGAIFSPPLLFGDMLVIASSQSKYNLLGYDLSTGKVKWEKRITDVESAPASFDRSVYLATLGGDIYRIDPLTGKEIFHEHYDAPFRTSPALFDSICVLGCDNGYVYAISPADGKPLWKYDAGSPVWCSASISDSLIFVGTVAGKLVVLKMNGELSFELPNQLTRVDTTGDGALHYFGGDNILSMPITDGKMVYFGCNDGNFYAVNLVDSTVIWKDSTDGPIVAPPIQTQDQIIFGSFDENLYVVNKLDGKIEQKIDLRGRVRTSPAVYRDFLVVCAESSKVIGFKIR